MWDEHEKLIQSHKPKAASVLRRKYIEDTTPVPDRAWVEPDPWSKISLPLIRKTFPSLVASDIVGVQPMSGPTGMVFKMGDETPEQKRIRLHKERQEKLRKYNGNRDC